MRGYSMNYRDTMELPLHVFWTLNAQINRLQAEESLELFSVGLGVQCKDEDRFAEYQQRLLDRMGTVVKEDRKTKVMRADLDRDGLNELRALM